MILDFGKKSPRLSRRQLLSMVGARRFELLTSWSRTKRANQAALRPENQQIIAFGIWRVKYLKTVAAAILTHGANSSNDIGCRSRRDLAFIEEKKAETSYKARNPTLRGFVPRAWFDFMTGSFTVCWRIYLQPEAHV